MSLKEITAHLGYGEVSVPRKAWWHYIKFGVLLFGLIIFGVGVGLYFIPFPSALKDLLSGAVVGAGIAAILAEFTFSFERRASDENQQVLTTQNQNLLERIEVLKSYVTKKQSHRTAQVFRLGISIALLMQQQNIQDTTNELITLAEVLDIRDVVEKFNKETETPFEQAAPALAGALRSAIALRYSQECVDAYAGGYATVYFLFASEDDTGRILDLIKKGVVALDLPSVSTTYIEGSIRGFETQKIPRKSLQLFFSLLGLYVMNITTGAHPDIARFFAKDCLPLSNEATVQRILELLNAVADSDKKDTTDTQEQQPDSPTSV